MLPPLEDDEEEGSRRYNSMKAAHEGMLKLWARCFG
jgi:hypothetical protein